ncbi:putative MerR-family transcriptional regulator [Actinoplanes missouriensis 431]|uniref:Putative MerR-family transcriptional regulator n=1 Tax=Actinoplanes missouriensis (strain ATCC 14538 / DSM 43046 / CBS 188.64 / JCM 3121 / NBRC 102363 / NCIMB 12654 / NRRL B-3342 / UNCC 431) TaxID=512565 RepID=I0HJK2_ACTM4|nr:MerR family transcriptional regulator [Actinoplanes missouriensis]BAL93189.1 putative MerR-family transcriptional regulator [Actinoplanes missouriensis 431]
MLSIKDFSEMSHLSAQTLRYYHAEGLLVPAHVDEQTGYRSYTFDQVADVMLISVLREAGLGVKEIRRALDEPDVAPGLLREHQAEVQRRRAEQDEAIRTAGDLLEAPPQPCLRRVPAMTVVSRLAPVTPLGRDRQEWDLTEAILRAATEDLLTAVRSGGATPAGTPWRMLAPGRASAAEGPFWLIQVPLLDGPATLADVPPDAEVHRYEAAEELSITMPGRTSLAKYCTAIGRLLAYPLDGAFPDIARLRHLVREDGVEFSVPVRSC